MRSKKVITVVTGALSLLLVTGHQVLAAPNWDEMVQKVTAALPDKAQVTPVRPHKLLVFTLAHSFVHSSIPIGAKAIELMGQKTGAYTTTVSDDISMFETAKLNQFDGVCFISTVGNKALKDELFVPKGAEKLPPADQQAAIKHADELTQNLLNFVAGGKGIVGIHAASDCYKDVPQGADLIGGVFNGHPWNEQVGITIEDKNSPLTRDLVASAPDAHFDIADEIYQFRTPPYDRTKQRVLLALNLARTPHKDSMARPDNDFAVSWIKNYGQGRVYYCSLGHREEIYWNPQILKYYLNGIQFALGDLRADTTPLPQPAQVATATTTATLNGTNGATPQTIQLGNAAGGAGGAQGAAQPPADPVDNFMGEYTGTFTPEGGAATRITADVVGEGNGSYRVVLFMPTADAGQTNRVEITGKQQDNAVPFTGNAGGMDWTGSLGDNKLNLTGKGNGGGQLTLQKIVRHSPTEGIRPPANAIVLLPYVPGQAPSMNEWKNKNWPGYADGSVSSEGGDTSSVRDFGDMQLHCEFRLPYEPTERGQGRANSGLGFIERYEIQILDSFGLKQGAGDVGSIYNITPPSSNPELPPLQWQTYDIIFHAPRMGPDGKVEKLPRVTVYLDGVKVQDDKEIPRGTGIGPGEHAARGPLKLQFHHHPVRFRNIWAVELNDANGGQAEQNLQNMMNRVVVAPGQTVTPALLHRTGTASYISDVTQPAK